jgi:hypothetical protein
MGTTVFAESMNATPPVRPETRVRVPQHVVHREFPVQTVVLNLRTGRYHGLNPTAGRMLDALEHAPNVASAARIVAERYRMPRADVERDMCEFCSQLLERGLLELVEASAAA